MIREDKLDVAVVGAGILGLAHAAALAKAGLKVGVFERTPIAVGASVRNFGMVWPIGQPPGEMREIALNSRKLWKEHLNASGIWHRECGSIHLAYTEAELGVLEEFVGLAPQHNYDCSIIGAAEVAKRSPHVKPEGLLGAMYSPSEVCVFPRQVVRELPAYLASLGVAFHFSHAVSAAGDGELVAGGKRYSANKIILCTGDDFETLFPEQFGALGMTRSKLQMMRARPKQADFAIGTHVCAGLTQGHYANFRICEKLADVLKEHADQWPTQVEWGIHLLVSQHEDGCLTIGDSHEYGLAVEPFMQEAIDAAILEYLDTFLPVSELEVFERWYGVYAKHPTRNYIVETPAPGVTAVTGVGGAGMTLSFGLADKVVRELIG